MQRASICVLGLKLLRYENSNCFCRSRTRVNYSCLLPANVSKTVCCSLKQLAGCGNTRWLLSCGALAQARKVLTKTPADAKSPTPVSTNNIGHFIRHVNTDECLPLVADLIRKAKRPYLHPPNFLEVTKHHTARGLSLAPANKRRHSNGP